MADNMLNRERQTSEPLSPSIFGFIWKYSRREQLLITAITIVSFPFIYLSLYLPKVIVNDAIAPKTVPPADEPFTQVYGITLSQPQYLLGLCALLFALYLINGGFLFAVSLLKNAMSERLIRRLRYMLFQRVLRFPMAQFSKVSNAEMGSMIVGEVDRIREFMSDAISLPIFQGGTFSVILFFMFMQDWILGLAAIALIPFQAWITPKFQRRINELGRLRVQQARKLSGRVSENVSGIRDIRSNHTFQYALADFSAYLQRIFKIRFDLFQVKFLMKFVNNFLLKLTPLAFYAIGGLLIIEERLTIGALVAVISAYGQLTAPWKELLKYYQRRGDAQIKYEQLVEVFEVPGLTGPELITAAASSTAGSAAQRERDALSPPQERVSPSSQPGDVTETGPPLEINNLTVSDGRKTSGDEPTLVVENFKARVPAGQALALVVPPSVRDRLAAVMGGLVSPVRGSMAIGGTDLLSLPIETRARRLAYVGNESYAFEGSVGENVDFALQRTPVEAQAAEDEQAYDRDEAERTGNSVFDASRDWSGATPENERMKAFRLSLIRAVCLDDEVFRKAMGQGLPDTPSETLVAHIIETRRKIHEDEAIADLFLQFQYDAYNTNASVAENLVFGEPIDNNFSAESLGRSTYVREALAKAGIEQDFYAIGIAAAEKLVSIFSDPDAEANLLDRFRLVDQATLDRLGTMNLRKLAQDVSRLSADEKAMMTAIACRLVVARHRLGLVDERIQDGIVKARHHLLKQLPDEEKKKIAAFEQDGVNPKLTLLCNLLMGRVALDKPRAERRVLARIKEIARDTGLYEHILEIGCDFQVGIGGQNLSYSGRQALLLARALAKKPDILIADGAISSFDPKTRHSVRRNIFGLLPQLRMVWLETERPMPNAFSQVIELQDLDTPLPATAETTSDEETGLEQEAQALGQLPLFKDVSLTNRRLVALASRRVTFEPGEAVLTQGDVADVAYVILEGDMDIISDQGTAAERTIARVSRNELVGETSLLINTPRTAGGIATTRIEALAIERATFLRLMDSDVSLAAAVARLVSQRLSGMLEMAAKTKREDADEQA